MERTITTIEAELMNLAYCDKCKATKGHYAYQHEAWKALKI